MYGAVGFFEEVDIFDIEDQKQENLDLSFLEAMDSAENIFGIDKSYFKTLDSLTYGLIRWINNQVGQLFPSMWRYLS